MKYLNLKLLRDLRKNGLQFFSVFLMAFLSILVFVGLQGVWGGLDVSLTNFISENGLADAWVYSTGFSDADIKAFENISGVQTVYAKHIIDVKDISNNAMQRSLSLSTYDENSPSSPYIVRGKTFHKQVGGIWINKGYAEANDLQLNQELRVMLGNREVVLVVEGFILSTDKIYFTGTQEFIAPNNEEVGYGLISLATWEETLDLSGLPGVIEIIGDSEDVRLSAESIMGERHGGYYNRSTLSEVSEALGRVNQIRNLSYMFSFIFILLAILAMYTTIKRLIETQTKEIAVLQALGFSSQKIGFHYSSFGLLVGGIGITCGLVIAPMLSSFVLETQKNMLSLPHWKISYNYFSLVICGLVLLVCVSSAFLASREARISLPVHFLRGTSEKKGSRTFLERSDYIWSKLNYENRWGIRDAAINKIRILMGIIGVAGGMMLITAGLGMPTSINYLVEKAYTQDFTYEQRINTSNYRTLKSELFGQWIQTIPSRFSPDDGYNRLLMVIEEGEFIHMQTTDGDLISVGGFYVTEGFAERAKIKKGDTVSVYPAFHEHSFTFEVTGIISSETNQGAYIFKETWEKAGGSFKPQTLLIDRLLDFSEVEENTDIVSTISIADQKQNAYDFVESLQGIFSMIIAFAILLVVVVLYNLGTLNFVERMRDYTTLNVLGMTNRELRRITMIENIFTTLIGWCVGIPAGSWFLTQYVQTFSTIHIDYQPYIYLPNVLIATSIVWICSLSTTIFVSQRIKKIDLVEALKNID
ncbi:ABC transporter permease [Enterococcus sp. RIT-PI-f]|uniref:ABC transporter permease n=1 Tax=Enterococcus sp. RIT-PI-f TaxID=1690244 RepID=UPI0006B92377|nr:ABC transporter permease [Enterococcus sp. RIT-PI-f]KPG69749.1 ABC transporter permease [Enterococcus sp. RIT-PI-f]